MKTYRIDFLNRKEDLRIPVNLSSGSKKIQNVICKIFLPTKLEENPILVFLLDQEGYRFLVSHPQFSLNAQFNRVAGSPERNDYLHAEKVTLDHISVTHWSSEVKDQFAVGNPSDLLLDETLQGGTEKDSVHCTFWLSNNQFIEPPLAIESSYLGDVKVKRIIEHSTLIADNKIKKRQIFRMSCKGKG